MPKARRSQRKSQPIEEEEHMLKTQPDGNMLKVKQSKHKSI